MSGPTEQNRRDFSSELRSELLAASELRLRCAEVARREFEERAVILKIHGDAGNQSAAGGAVAYRQAAAMLREALSVTLSNGPFEAQAKTSDAPLSEQES